MQRGDFPFSAKANQSYAYAHLNRSAPCDSNAFYSSAIHINTIPWLFITNHIHCYSVLNISFALLCVPGSSMRRCAFASLGFAILCQCRAIPLTSVLLRCLAAIRVAHPFQSFLKRRKASP
jgi:hypothetical protein